MSANSSRIQAMFTNLPEHAVLTKAEVCALTKISDDTMTRLHRRGEGPARVQLSPRRVGYTVGALRVWLEKRSIAA